MNSRLKLCTFDVTNTLLKFQMPVGEQYAKVGRIYGVDRDPCLLTKAFLHHWKEMNLKHPNYGQTTGLTSQSWWKEMVLKVFSFNNSKVSSKQIDSISDHLYNLYKTEACWKVTSGAKPLLTRLKEKQVILGVISNFDERLDSVLSSTGLKSHFHFILASYTAQVAKPSKEIFDLALCLSPGVKPCDAVHVGDNVNLDYLAAKNAGWNALLISSPRLTSESVEQVSPNEIVKNIEDIEKMFLHS